MKKSVLVILLSLLSFAGPAQVRLPFKNPFGESKTQLRQKNAKLQSTIDSLRALLDSVEVARREEAESAINILETEVQRPEPPKYDPALMKKREPFDRMKRIAERFEQLLSERG